MSDVKGKSSTGAGGNEIGSAVEEPDPEVGASDAEQQSDVDIEHLDISGIEKVTEPQSDGSSA